MSENKVQEALQEIQRGTSEIIDIEAIEKLIKRYYETVSKELGYEPSFTEYVELFIKLENKQFVDNFYEAIKEGWLANDYKSVDNKGLPLDFKDIYDDIFNKVISTFVPRAGDTISSNKYRAVDEPGSCRVSCACLFGHGRD